MNYLVHIVSVCGLVENNEGKILMIKTPDRGWEIRCGQVDEGESLTDGLIREVMEETRIHIEVGWFDKDTLLEVIDEDFTRDKVQYMLNYDGKITYGVFSRNPYVLHELQYL